MPEIPSIRTRRWNDPVEADDGQRILICRYRPRGLKKADETWDLWLPELGPSKELHAAVYGKGGAPPLPWTAYRRAYLTEMLSQKPLIADLAGRVRGGHTVTLLCSSSCVRENRCHRSLLKSLIEEQVQKLGTAPT